MTPVVVAWVVQVAWEIARCSLGANAFTAQAAALSYAVTVATTFMAVLGFASVARRTTGTRRAGAVVAGVAYVAMAATLIAREILGQAHSAYAIGLARGLRNGGWSVLEAVAIIGLAVAAGRRGRWLAPPAIGLVFFALPPGTVYGSEIPWLALVWRVLAIAICVVLATDTQRAVSARDPNPAAAARGAFVAERLCWFFVALNIASLATGGGFAFGRSLAIAIANVAGDLLLIIVMWWIANAGIARLLRWPLYASAACALWALVRTGRQWLLTIVLHWGNFGAVSLHLSHWAYGIPSTLSNVLAVIAYAAYARRTHRRGMLVIVAAWGACTTLHLAMRIAGIELPWSEVALLAGNIAAALLYRMLGTAFQAEVPPEMPPARVV